MNFEWVPKYAGLFASGLLTTFELVVLSGILGFALAILVGFGRVSRNPLIFGLTSAFTSVIRGTPLLVQIFLFYSGLGALFALFPEIKSTFFFKQFLRDGFLYLVLSLTLSVGGYVGEVVRGALLSVPRGELEAARAYGFHGTKLVWRIWLPRALQSMMPTFAGESVLLLKSTALASSVAVVDLLGAANKVRSDTLLTYEPLLFVAAGYFVSTLVIEAGFRRFERHYAKTHRPA